MIDKFIVQYLADHRRVVVPGFGAFIRDKESGEPVFVELLRHDDGILRALIREKMNVDDDEALRLISNYTARIRKMLAMTGSYPVAELGTLHLASDGKYTFIPLKTQQAKITNSCTSEKEISHAADTIGSDNTARERMRKAENTTQQTAKPDRTKQEGHKKKTDKTLLVAIIAAVIALVALLYGMFSTPDPVALDLETTTQQADTTAGTQPELLK